MGIDDLKSRRDETLGGDVSQTMHRGNCMCPAQVFNLIFAKGVNFACHSSSNEESVNYGVGVLFYYSYYPEPRGPNCLSYTMTLFDGKITHSQPGQSVVNQEKLRTMVTQPLSKGLIKMEAMRRQMNLVMMESQTWILSVFNK